MWYLYLNRETHYLRSYRTHNLWFDYYQKKARQPRVTSFHLGLFKRLAKTYSGVSCILPTEEVLSCRIKTSNFSIGSYRFNFVGYHTVLIHQIQL